MTVYIRPEDRDTRYPLWYVLYKVRVPYIQSMTVEELSQRGIYTSGIGAYDHATAWEPRLMSVPIVRIIELWHNGANVYIVDIEKHCRPIYEAVQKHLEAWAHYKSSAYNLNNYPEEDLKIMDDFNNVMYEHAKWVESKRTWDGLISNRNVRASIATISDLWDKNAKIRREEEDKKRGSVENRRYNSKRGDLKFSSDPVTHRKLLEEVADMSHAGKPAVDIHPKRTSWSDLIEQYGR